MSAEILYGEPVAVSILQRMNKDSYPDVKLVMLGFGDQESASYTRQIQRTAKKLMRPIAVEYRSGTVIANGEELLEQLRALNDDTSVNGYVIEMPLPEILQDCIRDIRRVIDPKKDVDAMSFEQRGRLLDKDQDQLPPATPYAVMKLLKHYGCDVHGRCVVVVGGGNVGKPLSIMLQNDNATVTTCNEHSKDLPALTQKGDIVIGATGCPNLLTADHIKEGAVVINVGMKYDEASATWLGDVDVEGVQTKASKVSPVLKGIGNVTASAILQNTVRAAKMQRY